MCCLTTLFLVLISRIGILVWWLANPLLRNAPFESWVLPGMTAFPAWLWTLAAPFSCPGPPWRIS